MSTFNDELDKLSAELKSENGKGETNPSRHSEIKLEIQPNDKVLFDGRPATVVSTWNGSDDVVIMQDGMTIECSKKQLKVYNKVDVLDAPMKFKDGLPVTESAKTKRAKSYVRCQLIGDSSPLNSITENIFVDFGEWKRKKGRQKVKLVCEDMVETFDAPQSDILLLDLPDGNLGQTDGYVNGAIVNSEGEPERKVMIQATEYATTTDDSAKISVLYFTNSGFQHGFAPKSMLKTLSV